MNYEAVMPEDPDMDYVPAALRRAASLPDVELAHVRTGQPILTEPVDDDDEPVPTWKTVVVLVPGLFGEARRRREGFYSNDDNGERR